MNVVLLILQIIGWVLLSVVALALLIVLLILFVPIRYKGTFRYLEKPEGSFEGNWLFSLLRVQSFLSEDGFTGQAKVLWKKIDLKLPEKKEEEPKEEEQKTEEPKEKKPFQEKFEELKKKLKLLRAFADDERITEAVSYTLRKVKQLLHHLMPKKMYGKVEYGLSSPYDTAVALSYISAFVPVHKNSVEVLPDFQNQKFNADVSLEGRVFLIFLAYVGLAVILHKNVWYLIRTYKKYFGKQDKQQKEGNENG